MNEAGHPSFFDRFRRPKIDLKGGQAAGGIKAGFTVGPSGEIKPNLVDVPPPENAVPLAEKKSEAPKPTTPEAKNALVKGSLREKVANALKTEAIASSQPSAEHDANDAKELLKVAEAELAKLQNAIKDQIVDNHRNALIKHLDLPQPLEQKDVATINELLSNDPQKQEIENEYQKSLAEMKDENQTKILEAQNIRRKQLKDERENHSTNLHELSLADARGRIRKQKIENGKPAVDENKQPIYEDPVDVNGQILEELKAIKGQEDLTKEFETMLQNESVLDAGTAISEELRKNPESSLFALRDNLTTLQGLYNLCDPNDATGRGVIAALMYQEISGIDIGGITSNPDSRRQIDAALGKIRPNGTVFDKRLDNLIAEVGSKNPIPRYFDKKDILKTFVITTILDRHPSIVQLNEQGRTNEIGPQLTDIMKTYGWSLGEYDRDFVISMVQKGNVSSMSNAFHLENLSQITDSEGRLKIIGSAVDDIMVRRDIDDPDGEIRKQRIQREVKFYMDAFNNIKDKKEKSLFWGALGPLLLAALLNGQALLSSGVDDLARQGR